MSVFRDFLLAGDELLDDAVIFVDSGNTVRERDVPADADAGNYYINRNIRFMAENTDLSSDISPALWSDDTLSLFRCPISLAIMTDPVVASDGMTYERACIEEWIRRGVATSPLTREVIVPPLVNNILLQQMISAYNTMPETTKATSKPDVSAMVTRFLLKVGGFAKEAGAAATKSTRACSNESGACLVDTEDLIKSAWRSLFGRRSPGRASSAAAEGAEDDNTVSREGAATAFTP